MAFENQSGESQFYLRNAELSVVDELAEESEKEFARTIGSIKNRPDPNGDNWRKLIEANYMEEKESKKNSARIEELVSIGKISPNLGMISLGLLDMESSLQIFKNAVDNGYYQFFGGLNHFVNRNCLGIEIELERTGLKPYHSAIIEFVKQRRDQIFAEAIKYIKRKSK